METKKAIFLLFSFKVENMSDKHGAGASQWTKAALEQKHTPNQTPYEAQTPYAQSSSFGRFQAPSLMSTPIGASLSAPSVNVNVPVPGFVPPAFQSSPSATSVLTPNPYAASSANPYAGESYLKFSKIINVMNAATLPNAPTSSTTGPTAINLPLALTSNNSSIAISSATQSSSAAAGAAVVVSSQQLQQQQQTVSMQTVNTSASHGRLPNEFPGSSHGAGAINATIAENVLNAISNTSSSTVASTSIHGRLLGGIGLKIPDENKLRSIEQVVESGIGYIQYMIQ